MWGLLPTLQHTQNSLSASHGRKALRLHSRGVREGLRRAREPKDAHEDPRNCATSPHVAREAGLLAQNRARPHPSALSSIRGRGGEISQKGARVEERLPPAFHHPSAVGGSCESRSCNSARSPRRLLHIYFASGQAWRIHGRLSQGLPALCNSLHGTIRWDEDQQQRRWHAEHDWKHAGIAVAQQSFRVFAATGLRQRFREHVL